MSINIHNLKEQITWVERQIHRYERLLKTRRDQLKGLRSAYERYYEDGNGKD